MVDIREIYDKLKEWFSWENLGENLPALMGIGVGILIIDRVVGLGEKLAPVYDWVKSLNEAEAFETIDTVGDNVQFIDLALRAFRIDIGKEDLKKLADFLQDLGTGGKYLSKLVDVVKEKVPSLKKIGFKRGSKYKEIM